MPDINEIARLLVCAHGDLAKAHKSFNQINSADENALDRDARIAWQSVVSALDALHQTHDWAIDNM